MKQLNKLLALALAVIMVMALATTAFAEGDEESKVTITVNNALAGGEYKAYKIFDVTTSGSGENASYAYTIEENNSFFFAVQSYASQNNSHMTLKAIDGTSTTYNVILDDTFEESDSKTLAKELAKTLTSATASIDANGTARGTTGEGENANATATFSKLEKGCYLITSPVGSTSALITATDNTAKIDEKTGLPTLEKKVNQKDDITSTTAPDIWADYNDAAFGQTVQFKIEIQVDKTSDDYVLTDELPSGFTLNETTPITVQCAEYYADENPKYKDPKVIPNDNDENYKLETENLNDKTFQITFKSAYLSRLKALDKLIITYSATVGTNATVGVGGNTNTAKLTYGTNQTKEAETKTYIWSFDVSKFVKTGTESTETPLAGATFQLSTDEAGNNPVSFMQDDTSTKYKKTNSTTTDGVTAITTSTDGKFTLQGLDSGTYYLTETAAPAGYNKLEGPIKVEIGMSVKDDGTASYTVEYANWQESVNGNTTDHYGTSNPATNNEIPVENKAGSLLPSTGGIGTTIFYVLGGILVVGAGVLLITKKRMSNSK